MNENTFTPIQLDQDGHLVYLTLLPVPELHGDIGFTTYWDLHPKDFHTIRYLGKEVKTPRWQQAYGRSYRYTGARNNALPIPTIFQPFLDWTRRNIDLRLNGLLVNWYDGKAGHYIGAHRDDRRDLLPDSPIVTISLGEERHFRLRPYQGSGFKDVPLQHGTALVMPWNTNLAYTHEVPKMKKYQGRRISITARAFTPQETENSV